MKVKCAYCGNNLIRYVKRKNYFCNQLHNTLFKIDESKKMTKEERRLKYCYVKK